MSADSDQILRLVLLGFWAPIGLIVACYFGYLLYNRIISNRFEYRNERGRDETAFVLNEIYGRVREIYDTVRGQSSFTEKYFEGISHRLDQAMERRNAQLNDQVHYFISSLRSDLETNRTLELPSLSSEEPRSIVARQNIVREISHALYTPLSRIDAIASNVTAESPNRTIIEKMEKAKSAVEICYAYLAGYRNVINVTEKTSYWTPQSLKKAIQASSEVFIDATSKKPQIQIRAPESVRSVSNIFMLAVLLPLIENAVEASQNDDVINIDVHDVGGRVFASVTNPLH